MVLTGVLAVRFADGFVGVFNSVFTVALFIVANVLPVF